MSFIQKILSFVLKWFPDGSNSLIVSWLWFPYTSVSALISRRQPDRVFACGLLASTGIANSDRCQATEFAAIRALLNCSEGQSFWLCGTDIRSGAGFLLGDPTRNHILYNPPPFEEIYDPSGPDVRDKIGYLLGVYLRRVTETTLRLTSGDVLCLVLCGHGLPNGKLVMGDGKIRQVTLGKGMLEAAVRTCKADVHLFTTASHGGSWTSPCWSLFAAAPSNQESVSIIQPDLGNFRDGIFSACLMAEHADEHSLQAPKLGCCAVKKSNGEYQGIHEKDDFSVFYLRQRRLTCGPLRRTTPEVITWLHALRDHIQQTHPGADLTFAPPHTEKLQAPQAASIVTPQLSKSEEEDLLRLSEDHNMFLPPYSLSEAVLTRNCAILADPDHKPPLTMKEKVRTLKSLQLRSTYRLLSLTIAQKLGWEKAIKDVGLPFEKQRQLGPNISLQLRATENGYWLDVLYSRRYNNSPWVGAGGWLARVWQAAGEPTIQPEDWFRVLEESCQDVGLDPLSIIL